MQERDNIISFLLQACDQKGRIIEDLTKQNTELQKKVDELQKQVVG